MSFCLSYLGKLAGSQGDMPAARRFLEESLAINREGGDSAGIARSLEYLGTLAADQADYMAARSLYEECLAIRQELGDRRGIAVCLEQLAGVEIGLGDRVRAAPEREAAENGNGRTRGARSRFAGEIPGSLPARCHYERAARLLGAAKVLREAIGAPMPPAERTADERSMTVVRAALGEAVFAAAWSGGQSLSLAQVIGSARSSAAGTAADAPRGE